MAAAAVDVQVACDGAGVPAAETIEAWVQAAVAGAGVAAGAVEVSVRVVGAWEMQALNLRYRAKDSPTNVLSFPAGDLEPPADTPRLLGDIVVCASVVASEATGQGKRHEDHWAHILVHGTLHLLGFDHGTDAEAAAMESLEQAVLAAGGVADPYGAG